MPEIFERRGNDPVSRAKDQIADLRSRVRDLEDAYSQLRRRGEEAALKTKHRVEERPFASLLTAAGIGAVIGALFARRR